MAPDEDKDPYASVDPALAEPLAMLDALERYVTSQKRAENISPQAAKTLHAKAKELRAAIMPLIWASGKLAIIPSDEAAAMYVNNKPQMIFSSGQEIWPTNRKLLCPCCGLVAPGDCLCQQMPGYCVTHDQRWPTWWGGRSDR